MRTSTIALFASALLTLSGCVAVPVSQPTYYAPAAGAYVTPAPVYVAPPVYYAPSYYPYYWGPSIYFGYGYRGGYGHGFRRR